MAMIHRGDADALRKKLANSEFLRSQVNAPLGAFGQRPLHIAAKQSAIADVLIDFGADPNLKSEWKNGPYSVLDDLDEKAVRHLLARGARLTPNVAARLGWIDELRAMLDRDPSLVHARGGDGKTPLHEAKTTEIVDFLLERGADINARCIDHHSTAAMYALMDRPDICAHLLRCGAAADLYQAAHLGDLDIARRVIAKNPESLSARVNFDGYAAVPKFSIYCWTIGWYVSPLQLARRAGHTAIATLIEGKQDARQHLLDAAWEGDEASVNTVLASDPAVVGRVTAQEHSLLPAAAHLDRPKSVRLMLKLGFDVNARANDGGTTLHQACWIGNAEMVEMLLATGRCALDDRNDDHKCTPIGWAAYGSVKCGHGPKQYEKVIRMMAASGADLKQPGNLNGGTIAGMAKGNPAIEQLLISLGAG
jgi:ankyrin repeat protein